MILVPVKNLANAKQRLAALMPQSARTELAQTMLLDVLDALRSYGESEVALVTSDRFAISTARDYGFDIIRDDANVSETAAIEMATRLCVSRGIEISVVIPADVPLITTEELSAIFENAPASGSVLVPAHDKRGTNAILRRSANLFPLQFGNDSFLPHLKAAISTDTTCTVLSLRGTALDIDTPDDLAHLADRNGEKRSQLIARRGCGSASKVVIENPEHASSLITE